MATYSLSDFLITKLLPGGPHWANQMPSIEDGRRMADGQRAEIRGSFGLENYPDPKATTL